MKLSDLKLAYHEHLNPKLWVETTSGPELKPVVAERLFKIAQQFATTLNVPDAAIRDYVLTGSNANFNWTRLSDIDVHLLIDPSLLGDCKGGCEIDTESCLQAKKTLWNDHHDIEIYGHPVEVYASTEDEPAVADAGSYSLASGAWLKLPQRKQISMDSKLIRAKADELASEIDALIDSKADDESAIEAVMEKIWRLRAAGLQRAGEFSVENLTFKALRNNGYLDKIKKYAAKATDKSLSLESLTELFDPKSSIPLKVETKSKRVYLVIGELPDSEVSFEAELVDPDKDHWDVSFSRTDDHNQHRYHLTKQGDEFKVFNFVSSAWRQFMTDYEPERVTFYAAKDARNRESRGNIYQKMAVKLFGDKYELQRKDIQDAPKVPSVFKLVKKGR